MEKSNKKYKTYLQILDRELVPAMGCTEPIALAFCAAKARAVLGVLPDTVDIIVSGNIIKNVKSVIVPHTGGMKGMESAAAIGILAGRAERGLEVLSDVTESEQAKLGDYLKSTAFHVSVAESDEVLDIMVRVSRGKDNAAVRIVRQHTNIVKIEKNGITLFEKSAISEFEDGKQDYTLLSIKDIYDFALSVDIDDVKAILDRQIQYNTAVSKEGLKKDYGANIGTVLLKSYGGDVRNRAKAKAAAGSDARMNGSELPVIINSGSGNQGMATSLPIIEYARELNSASEQLYRALVISNLTAIHQKTGIGALSAYCGAVSAGAAAGAGIAFLHGGDYNAISHTIINALAITSGIVCDGAKASCAAKIAAAVDAGILGYDMYQNGQQFYSGDGIVSEGVENTIRNIGLLGKDGMRETDKEILCIMTCFD
ncbi:MAG: L-serine ammonia-lyase, iron-sulfur-dependent, subunit alpha [Hespellia sp.]|nr:L-serine ammonia-lyase, iron-sulfur-dependent, subunit alpha [Hespellia sp.]